MASTPSSPRSEGEILESDLKATTSLIEPKDISVDRHSRKRVSMSRSPSPYRSPRHRGSRSGSRSPYREFHGSKRPAEDDHYDRKSNDPRRFKVRYEDQTSGSKATKNPFQREIDRRSDGIYRTSPYDDRGTNGRPRDGRHGRSRSPPVPHRGHQKNRSRNSRNDPMNQPWQKHYDRGYGESRSKLSTQQLVSDRCQPPAAAAPARHDAEIRNNQTQQFDSTIITSNHAPANDEYSSHAAAEISIDAGGDEPMDEAALIEERRKRREAIKAKHKGLGTPLLVQALALDKSAPSTPKAATYENEISMQGEHQRRYDDPLEAEWAIIGSPVVSPPTTPRGALDQNSSSDISAIKESDLANSKATVDTANNGDEPSAADYDPTMDMPEDKIRQYQHQNKAETYTSAYDETVSADQDLVLPGISAQALPVPLVINELDMFGDDDELDMFAEAPVAAPKANKNTTKAVPVSQGKSVDMSMLDDCDDQDGYYKVILGELLESRYLVQSNLGKGMFSGVVRATDQKTTKLVAIKVVRNNETMRKTGFKEIEILEKLMASDPEDKKHIIRLERYFEHKGHLCMVFENLSIDLREVLKKFGRDIGINLKAVREYARQMFLGLSLLRKCNILHADLKPDNILVNESRSSLKICDLGSASDASENEITQYLVSRFYRAPEIILGLPYDFAIDMWSIGCTLFELYTGKILFTGRSNNQMLRAIMECRGKFSHKLLRKAEFAGLHFDDLLNFRSVEKDRVSGKDVVRMLNLAKPTRDLKTRLMTNLKGMGVEEVKELTLFVDLLDRCLNLNPEKRCTPNEALKHPFIMRMVK